MTATTSGRIDFSGQQGLCDTNGIVVDRSMPAVLAGRMVFSSWTTFCDRLDEALTPARQLKKCTMIYMLLFGSLTVAMVIFGFISFSISASDLSTSSAEKAFIPFFVAFLLVMVGGCATMCLSARATKQMNEGLRKVCDDTSAMHPGISFHVRYEHRVWGYGRDANVTTTNYIEVYVSDSANATPVQGYVAPSAPGLSAIAFAEPESVEGGKKTPAERMGELDQMKGLLSEDEYQQKRAEILSDV